MRGLTYIAVGTLLAGSLLPEAFTQAPAEAPAAFSPGTMTLVTNGLVDQATFDADRAVFEEQEGRAEGLGPVYNAQSCAECHQNPVTGGISQITELRAGHFDGINFIDHVGGSLINDRAINPAFQERVLGGNEVRTFRTSLNTLGDGFVEAIDSNTLVAISNGQPAGMRGQFIQVPVNEANNAVRGGRFGWKNQHASLKSFSADAYLNEMGITSPLQPNDNTSNGTVVDDGVPNPEDDGADVDTFAEFMRATGVPPRDLVLAATADAQAGSSLFSQVGCTTCHVRNITTAPAGTVINGGALTVDANLGNKLIHPFGDFLLHDVGTGDGIVQNGGQSTRNKVRTAPLWGMRSRDRLMHDGETVNRNEAILRHAGEATSVINNYRSLSTGQKNQLILFLNSL
ncbi:MAG TPA: di-heme oxidoredictase family protein [Vicinamibacteria bacterium]|nr:di-heme oxidoredictase family protein [Vicinamibacteria bacterium]